MAVQIFNDMPDAAVHRGDPEVRARASAPARPTANAGTSAIDGSLSDWSPRATTTKNRNRPLFVAVTAAVHVVAVIGFLSVRHVTRTEQSAAPVIAEILEAPQDAEETPPMAPPPMQEVVYSLPTPDVVSIDVETITPPPVNNTAIAPPSSTFVTPPLVESVEYVRAPAPVYPRESSRRREYGTVVLRVLVDPSGRAAQIQIERSSGHERLDVAAREAVQKALFRPHEVNGVAQAAQVLIPIEFTRRAS
ncbi:MAG TPA: TonB family protein [Steroidobacteraceae bacterium]|nr:TonB family protein [Steroidobacteraceae bacterium]